MPGPREAGTGGIMPPEPASPAEAPRFKPQLNFNLIQSRNRPTDIETKLTVAKGERGGGEII